MKNLISYNKIFNIILTYLVLVNCISSEKRLCGDEKCQALISIGQTLSNYNPIKPGLLQFNINANVKIFSKPNSTETKQNDLWEVEIQGRRGFAPRRFIREDKIVIKTPDLVPVEYPVVDKKSLNNVNEPEIKSSEVLRSEESTTTMPLKADEIPMNIVKGTTEGVNSNENVHSTIVQKPHVVDGTSIESNMEKEDRDDGLVEDYNESEGVDDDDDDDEDDMDEENLKFDRNEILAVETENNSKEKIEKSSDEIQINTPNDRPDNYAFISIQENAEIPAIEKKTENTNSENSKKTDKIIENIIETNNRMDKQDNFEKIEENEKQTSINDEKPIENSANLGKTKDIDNDAPEATVENKNSKEGKKILNSSVENLNPDNIEPKENDESQLLKEKEKLNNPNSATNSEELHLEKVEDVKSDNISTKDNNENLKQHAKEHNANLNEKFQSENDQSVEHVVPSNILSKERTKDENLKNEVEKPTQMNNDVSNMQIHPEEVTDFSHKKVTSESGKELNTFSEKKDKQMLKTELPSDIQNDNEKKDFEEKYVDIEKQPKSNVQIENNQESDKKEPEHPKNENHNDNGYHRLDHQSSENHNQDNHDHHHDHHHGHHHHLPLFFKQPVPAQNENSKEREDSNKIINKNIQDNEEIINKNMQDHEEIIDKNKQDQNSYLNLESGHKDSVITSPGYEENDFVENPVELTTQNPGIQNSISKENLILNESEMIDLKFESSNKESVNENEQNSNNNENSKHIGEIKDKKIDIVNPQPLTQNIVQDSQDTIKNEPSNDNEMLTYALETFNTWSGKFIDVLNGFWNTPAHKDELLNVELERPFYSDVKKENIRLKDEKHDDLINEEYCENLGPNDKCPQVRRDKMHRSPLSAGSSYSESDFFTSMSDKILEMFDMLVLLCIAAVSSIIFAFGYYCICNSRKENLLINKLNIVERNLLAANKEVTILKQDLLDSRSKLSSIEDSTFGTNDMVNSLRKKIDEKQKEVVVLKGQISTLEEELENATSTSEDLNKIISEMVSKLKEQELLTDNIEELQKQMSEQKKTITEINKTLAEKSRDNTELHLLISEQSIKFQTEVKELQNNIEDIENEKLLIQSKFEEDEKTIRNQLQDEILMKVQEIEKLQTETLSIKHTYDEISRKWETSESKIESLKDVIRNMNKESWADIDDLIETVDIKADNLLLEKENSTLRERLEGEKDARKLLEDHVKIISEEVTTLKIEHIKAEKDKVEAQTRLDVLSNYFKEKEAQLQKDLTFKEALWMKQQGETTSTVEKIRTMQDEIQALKSQNDSLHAEIEAQIVAHKAQLTALENRAHETWLLSRQAERKYEEARSESTMLRRKLTALVSGNSGGSNNTGSSNDINRLQNSIVDGVGSSNLNNVPSPIHLDSPSSPALISSNLPPPPPFLPPPPFMPALPGFMGMPAPFALPPGGRPPPLGGRLVSPPPPPPQHRRGRYSPSLIDDDDDDYDDDDYDDDRSQRRGRNNRNYSPENGRYTPDSRYNYTTDVMSQYDTETDFSPQVSPREESFLRGRRGGSINRDVRHNDRSTPLERTNSNNSKTFNKTLSPSPQKNQTNSGDNRSNKSNKGKLSSSSEKSFDSRISKGKARV